MIPGLMQNMQPIDNEQALSDYYNSGEYAMMSNQANNNLMANAEAMGGMGGSTNANNLMRIAPQMGMQHLGTLNSQRMDNFNMMNSIYGSGLNAAAKQGRRDKTMHHKLVRLTSKQDKQRRKALWLLSNPCLG